MQHLRQDSTRAAVCFVCARRFPHVSGVKHNLIESRKLITYALGEAFEEQPLFFEFVGRGRGQAILITDVLSKVWTDEFYGTLG